MSRGRAFQVLAVTVVAGATWALLLTAVAHVKFGGDVRGFLFVGRNLYHPPVLATVPRCGAYGYDGQFYATLAADPWLLSDDTRRGLDAPAYRASRIGIPLLAWITALGIPDRAIVSYEWWCWLLALAVIALTAACVSRRGGSPWWALLLALNAGALTSLLRATPDAAALALLLGMLLLHDGGKHKTAMVLGALAILVRETSALAVAALALHELLRSRRWRALEYLVVPLLPMLAWQAWIRAVWRPNIRPPSGVSTPLLGLAKKLVAVASQPSLASPELWGTIAALLTVGAAGVVLACSGRSEAASLAFVAFSGLALVLSAKVYSELYASSRALVVAPCLALILAVRARRWWERTLLVAGPAAYAVAGILMANGELGPLLGRP